MILVTGATGNIGSELVRMLKASGHAVRALSRDAEKAKRALGDGVEIAVGDFSQPDSLAPALRGVEKAFFVAHAGPELGSLGAAFADAAALAGTRHVVAVSSNTIFFEPPCTLGKWHLALEEKIRATKLAWTFLRPGNFASNTLRWAQPIKTQGAVYSMNADQKSASIDPSDIAAVAAAALTGSGHEAKTYELTGSTLTTVRDQVAAIGKAIGKTINVVVVPEEGARQGMARAGLPDYIVESVIEVMRPSTRGEDRVSTHVRDVLGREPRTYEDWLAAHVSMFTR